MLCVVVCLFMLWFVLLFLLRSVACMIYVFLYECDVFVCVFVVMLLC